MNSLQTIDSTSTQRKERHFSSKIATLWNAGQKLGGEKEKTELTGDLIL